MNRALPALLAFAATNLVAQSAPPPNPNQQALAEARAHLAAGETAAALAAIEKITPPAPAALQQLRTSDDFRALRDEPRFRAVVAKLLPCAGPEHHQFDFWIGDWEVRDAAGKLLGRNSIHPRFDGCVLVEQWEGAGGTTGSSFNFWDAPSGKWHQFWVDSGGANWLSSDAQGNPETLRGGLVGADMVLLSHPDTLPSIGLSRATWRPLPDGRVRQTFESSSDGGRNWSVVFDGYYSKTAP